MKLKYFAINKILLMSLFVEMFLIGCSNLPLASDKVENSLFTGKPCAAPCWYGLEVGTSNEDDVMSTLSDLTFINQATIQIHRMSMPIPGLSDYAPGMEISARCAKPSNKQCLTLDVVNNVLTEIIVNLNYEIRASEVIKQIGDPDYVGYLNLGAEKIICEVYFVWSSKQVVLSSRFEGYDAYLNSCGIVHSTEKVPSQIKITEIRYFSVEGMRFFTTPSEYIFIFSGTIPDN
jgi:hypothetical protein